MDGFLLEAGSFLLRWLHVVAAIAWIGESFYFVALDRGLRAPQQPATGLHGESWSVHGGGFYLKQKYLPAPAQLPEQLHWSKWKSYTTWLSGFALLALLYLWSPQVYLVDPQVAALDPAVAAAAAIGFLLLAWLVYDALCRVIGFRDRLLGAAVAALTLALCVIATELFAGRAAFLLVGAALATIMSANVLMVIIPGQKRMVAALASGATPNPLDGQRGKQRSVHNTYFTLPVVFAMLSTHYAPAFAHDHKAVVLALFLLAAALIRQFFVLWHSGERAWGLLLGGALVLLGVLAFIAPKPRADAAVAAAPGVTSAAATPAAGTPAPVRADLATVQGILAQRCAGCHSAQPSLMPSPPKGAMFDQPALIEAQAALIHQQAVVLKIMPPGNLTDMSELERQVLDAWYASRADAGR